MAFGLITFGVANGHEKHALEGATQPAPETLPVDVQKKIKLSYQMMVKPIFEKKCFDCHSGETRYPWYYKIPGIKEMIEGDIREGRKHLDVTNDFPFKSHATPLEDLEAIEKTTREGTMPPWDYRLMQRGSGLMEEERKTILDWVGQGKELLKK